MCYAIFMSGQEQAPHATTSKLKDKLSPDIEERKKKLEREWLATPEAPLAFTQAESLTTPENVEQWLDDVERYIKVYPPGRMVSEFLVDGKLDRNLLRKRFETELRYLSLENIISGLKEFGKEILETFSKTTAVFYLPYESASAGLFYRTITQLFPELLQFGVIKAGRARATITERNSFQGSDVDDVEAYIYIDDWVLGAEHMSAFLTDSMAGKLHTFHLAVSNIGLNFFKAACKYVTPRYVYRVNGDGSVGIFAEVPIYGAHKIPDNMPEYYVTKHHQLYSIFGVDEDGEKILRNRRLVNHGASLVTE